MTDRREEDRMTFKELAIGAQFRFFEGGSLLKKVGERKYSAPQWGGEHEDLVCSDPDQHVIPSRTMGMP